MSEQTSSLSVSDAFPYAKNYLNHVLNKSMMAMYMDTAKKKTEINGVVIEELSSSSAERIFGQKKKLFTSILCLVEMGFKNLPKTNQQRRVSVKVRARESITGSANPDDKYATDKQRIVDGFVASMKEQSGYDLGRLTYHFEQNHKHHLAIARNPLNPENLARYISVSIHTLNIPDSEKLPLLSLLLGTLSTEYNELLKQTEQGVEGLLLPDLSDDDVAFRYENEYSREASIIQRDLTWRQVQENGGVEKSSLLAMVSRFIEKAKQEKNESCEHLIQVAQGLPIISNDDLLEGLKEFMPLPDLSEEDEENEVYWPQDEDVPPLAFQIQLVLDGQDAGLTEEVCDVLNFLSIMLSFIEKQNDAHPTIKMLLDYLRIPVVWLAIKDPLFVMDARNSVAVLLDTLWGVCVKWSPSENKQRDSVYNKVASIVVRVYEEFEDDYQIIDECIDDIDLFTKAERRRAKLLEERLIGVEKAKFKKDEANSRMMSHIEEKFDMAEFPKGFSDFIDSCWKPVIVMVYLKNLYAESQEWKDIHDIEDKLIRSMAGKGTGDTDILIDRIEKTLMLYGVQSSKNADLIGELKRLLSRPVVTASQLNTSVGGIPLPEMEVLEEEGDWEGHEPSRISSDAEPDNAFVSNIVVNNWFLLAKEGKAYRARVASIHEFSNTLIFVNRNGQSVGVYTRDQLVDGIQNDALTLDLLETDLFIDRALKGLFGTTDT